MRPDRTHVVFYRNGAEADVRAIVAHVDPAHPQAWQREPAAGEIDRLLRHGAVVTVEIGALRVGLRAGQPPRFASPGELAG
jgi:hypothetical protein